MSKHTPGPWKRSQFDPEIIVTEKRPHIHIAKVATTGMGFAVDPNAHLIAAAPELLQALENADKLLTLLLPGVKHLVVDIGFLNATLNANRDAIAKAKGS